MAAEGKFLLIARKNGKSASRRQRGFPAERVVAAIKRWEAEGFNGFWVYGPVRYEVNATNGQRGLIGQWHRNDDPAKRATVITTLGGTP